VYPYRTDTQPESVYQQKCDDALAAGEAAINDQANWAKYVSKVQIAKGGLNPNGKLYITGYAQFFAAPTQGDACDNTYFFPYIIIRVLKMTYATRLKMNQLVTQVNTMIQNNVVAVSGANTIYVDIDLQFNGKRFCEPANAADPIGADNPNVYFNDIRTTLEETTPYNPPSSDQEAAAWSQWEAGIPENATEGSASPSLPGNLQRSSVFHPKSVAHRFTSAHLAWLTLDSATS